MDGYVTIGTRLDTKELEKDLKNAERQLKQYEKESEKLTEQKLKVETEVQEYERQKQLIEEATDKRLKFAETEEQVNFVLGEEAIELSKLNEQYSQTFTNLENINNKIESNVRNQGLLNNKVSDLKGEINKVKGFEKLKNSIDEAKNKINEMGHGLRKIASIGINNISKKIDNVGKSVQGVTRKILRWGLALFGIRAAYGFIRQSINTISQQNEGIANQMDLMKNALTTALEPAIKVIISLLYTLFSFINSIVKELTGKDLFAAAAKNMKSGAGSAKEIKKQLAGFDEMNILSDSSSSGGGAGGFDTKGFVKENTKLLKILNKFKKMFKAGDWAGIGRTISNGIISGLNGLSEKIKNINWEGIGKGISDFLTNIDFSGIFVGLVTVFGEALLGFQNMWLNINWPRIFANLSNGLANAIYKIDEYIRQIKWKEISKMISNTITSVKWGKLGSSILETIWDAMAGLLTLILNLDWDKIARTVSESFEKWIATILKNFKETNWEEAGEKIANDISDFIENFDWIGVGQGIIATIIAGMTAYKEIAKGLIVALIDRLLKDLGLDEKARKKGKEIAEKIITGLIEYLMFTAFPLLTITIKTIFTDEGKKAVNSFVEGLKDLIPKVIKKFKELVSEINKELKKINPVNIGVKAGSSIGKKISNLFGFAKGGIVVPKLASGGIINQPGRGVPIASAVGGERGMEGVIPLTDSQQMSLLGEAIGRYITVELTNVTQLDGRQIARKVEQINQNNKFVLNG